MTRDQQADALLRSGYDPERENGSPRRSDAWCRALGWLDQIGEEAVERCCICGQLDGPHHTYNTCIFRKEHANDAQTRN